jgi:hypothetical protein
MTRWLIIAAALIGLTLLLLYPLARAILRSPITSNDQDRFSVVVVSSSSREGNLRMSAGELLFVIASLCLAGLIVQALQAAV